MPRLNSLEKDALQELRVAMTTDSRKVPLTTSIAAIRTSAEKLCKSYLLRKSSHEVTTETFLEVIRLLEEKGTISSLVAGRLHLLRKLGNSSIHSTMRYPKNFVDAARVDLLFLFEVYQDHTGIRFKEIDGMHKRIIGSIGAIAKKMQYAGAISEKEARDMMDNQSVNDYKAKNKKLIGNPTYALVLIDKSYSMINERVQVISAQNEAIAIIRESAKCRSNKLYLKQHLFNNEDELLNSLTIVSNTGDDQIVLLNETNYQTLNSTALYDSLKGALVQLIKEIDLTIAVGRKPEISVCVITDGQDTSSTGSAQEVKKYIEYIRGEQIGLQCRFILIGWTGAKHFSMSDLVQIQENMGFDEAIAIDKTEPSAIRKAFHLWSKRASK